MKKDGRVKMIGKALKGWEHCVQWPSLTPCVKLTHVIIWPLQDSRVKFLITHASLLRICRVNSGLKLSTRVFNCLSPSFRVKNEKEDGRL
jgi:hypothetical protein